MDNSRKHNWNTWYAVVLIVLLLQIVLYYLFTRYWK